MPLGFSFELTDFYCGAGGSSTGAVAAGVEVKNAANHWDRAIETHQQNHPHTCHYLTDLLETDPRQFPYTPIAWFSPECRTHSRGRGKSVLQPTEQLRLWESRDPGDVRSRTTMEQVITFSEHHRYEAVIVENVVDIKYWPPLSQWFQEMANLGYDWHTCYFNSMFFHPLNGQSSYAPQNRDRWYTVFWKRGNRVPDLDFRPLAWCEACGENVRAVQVFKKPVFPQGLYDTTGKRGQYYYACPMCRNERNGRQPGRVEPYYFAAWNCIDWSIPITRIGNREKPLKPNTMRRLEIGLKKFGWRPLVVELTRSQDEGNRSRLVTEPMMAQTTRQSIAFIVPMKNTAEYVHAIPASKPVPTLTTAGGPAVFLVEMYGNGDCRQVTEPVSTVTSGGVKSGLLLLPSAFLYSYYNRDNNQCRVDDPVPTIVCDNRLALVMPQTPFIVSYYGEDTVRPATEPLGTVTTVDRHAFVVNMQANNEATGIDEPLPTVLTGNHKYLAEPAGVRIEDCGFRMFEPDECKGAQGFLPQYVVLGNKREQVKQIGAAVSPPVAEFLVRAAGESLC
jgi:DNA (cytosine-5)-methyltransferase 1